MEEEAAEAEIVTMEETDSLVHSPGIPPIRTPWGLEASKVRDTVTTKEAATRIATKAGVEDSVHQATRHADTEKAEPVTVAAIVEGATVAVHTPGVVTHRVVPPPSVATTVAHPTRIITHQDIRDEVAATRARRPAVSTRSESMTLSRRVLVR